MISVISPLAASNSIFDPVSEWANFGVLGLVMLGLLTGWLSAKPTTDLYKEQLATALIDKAKAEGQRDAALEITQDKVIPLLTEFNSTTQALLPLLQNMAGMSRMNPTERRLSHDREDRD